MTLSNTTNVSVLLFIFERPENLGSQCSYQVLRCNWSATTAQIYKISGGSLVMNQFLESLPEKEKT